MATVLKVGYIPEHFSTPIAFASKLDWFHKNGVEVELIPYPSGSGHLITSLKAKEIDVAIGLTEAFVRGLAQGDAASYVISGEYVESPLCWSISTGAKRDEIAHMGDLKSHNRIGVSRIGSGSYVMPFVLALQQKFGNDAFKFEVLHNFKNLRDSVNDSTTDAFMWEYFTTKKYYDNGEIKKIGEVYTPWSSWVIASSSDATIQRSMPAFQSAIQQGIDYYNSHEDEAIDYILANLDYESRTDLKEWYKRTQFSTDVTKVHFEDNILRTKDLLRTAGIVTDDDAVVVDRLNAGVPAFAKLA